MTKPIPENTLNMLIAHLSTPLGDMKLTIEQDCISSLKFTSDYKITDENITDSTVRIRSVKRINNNSIELLKNTISQLNEYFLGQRFNFTLPLRPDRCTPFRKSIWHELLNIPYGETITYASLATIYGKPNAAKAVGNACAANPINILIPCHRVVGSNNNLGGYNGGIARKTALLELELKHKSNK